MKNLLYISLFVFTSTFLACKQDKTAIDKFILANQALEFHLEGLRDDSGNNLETLKRKVNSEGNPEDGLQSIKQADAIKFEAAKLIGKIDKIKKKLMDTKEGIDKKTGNLNEPSAKIYANDLGQLESISEDYLKFIHTIAKYKQEKSTPLSIEKEDYLTIANLRNQPLIAVLALLTQKQILIVEFEIYVIKNIYSK